MPTRRLANHRIRAAHQAAPTLDVRGPVSQALGRTGVVVEPDEPTAVPSVSQAEKPTGPPVPVATARGARPARRVVKPFKQAAWPTRAARPPEPETAAALTPDERRVHCTLIDALDRRTLSEFDGTGTAGLSYLERKRLEALDLAFINAELAKMEKPVLSRMPRARLAVGVAGAIGLGAIAGVITTGGGGSVLSLVTFLLLAVAGLAEAFGLRASTPKRQRIYEALRELALLTDDPGHATSQALRQSNHLMDQLAADAHRQQPLGTLLDVETPESTPSATRQRARS